MKRIVSVALTIMMVLCLVGCGSSEGSAETAADTVGGKYVACFNASDAKDASTMADELISGVPSDMELVTMEVEPGYLNGFTTEISGFTKGTMFSPMIGSIPFVGYVFESDDATSLEETLKGNADLRWNICTEADEMVSATKGNLVFFMMCTNEE